MNAFGAYYENRDLKKIGEGVSDRQLSEIINESETRFLEYLQKFHSSLGGDYVNLREIGDIVDVLSHLKKDQSHKYINSLVRPEKTRGSKIPSTMPVPSSSFQLKQSFYVTTNLLGNAAVVINPHYLGTAAGTSTVYVNNDPGLTGTGQSAFFLSRDIGQSIPAVYNMYRLVSASIVAKYVGRLDTVQGLIGGAILFDQNVIQAAAPNVNNANLAKYGQFSIAEDAFFQQENYVLQGIRELYFPIDNTFEQYTNVGTSRQGFAFMIYILNAPPNVSSFKFDCYFNFECLPDVTFLNYIPTTIGDDNVTDKEYAIKRVQNKPIMPVGEGEASDSGWWQNFLRTTGGILPTAIRLGAKYLPGVNKYEKEITAIADKGQETIGSLATGGIFSKENILGAPKNQTMNQTQFNQSQYLPNISQISSKPMNNTSFISRGPNDTASTTFADYSSLGTSYMK